LVKSPERSVQGFFYYIFVSCVISRVIYDGGMIKLQRHLCVSIVISGILLPTFAVAQAQTAADRERSFFAWFGTNEAPPSKPVDKTIKPVPSTSVAPEVVHDDAIVNEALAAVKGQKKAPEKQVLVNSQDLELARLETYLNSLSTIVSDFTQIAPDGGLTTGKFYLKRPGKMRWEYNPPTPILMIANGRTMVYYDSDLQQVSHLPIDSTLASLLARERIDLKAPDLKVESLTRAAGVLRITISQKEKPEEGSVTLEFSDSPLQIRNMVVTDAEKQTTSVSFSKAQFGKPLSKSLFVWVDPRQKR
jgi:outer membrane lipoprotein-sorting protein